MLLLFLYFILYTHVLLLFLPRPPSGAALRHAALGLIACMRFTPPEASKEEITKNEEASRSWEQLEERSIKYKRRCALGGSWRSAGRPAHMPQRRDVYSIKYKV